MTVPSLQRDLTRDELRTVVSSLSTSSGLWRPLVRHSPEQRSYEQLVLNEHLAVWLICWMEGHDTGFHDHDGSSGAVIVVDGLLREERLRVGGPPAANVYRPGDVFDFAGPDIHRVVHPGGAPAVSIHAYSPPLRGMGSYVWEADGALRRQLLGGDEELKPLTSTAA
jgi:predicted metal-dependent enzyme (double-stranded beta helix superfamily)